MIEATNKVIETLEYLSEKFGLVIEWTEENVMPVLTELMSRYRTYEIVRISLTLFFMIGITVCGILMLLKARNAPPGHPLREKYHDDEFNGLGMAIIVFMALFTMATLIYFPIGTENLMKWILLPEMEFLQMITGTGGCV